MVVVFFLSFFLLLSHHLCQSQRHCSCAALPGIPTSNFIKDSFFISATPEVHRWRHQIIGGLPSKGDTVLLPSYCCDLIHAGHPTDNKVHQIAESE